MAQSDADSDGDWTPYSEREAKNDDVDEEEVVSGSSDDADDREHDEERRRAYHDRIVTATKTLHDDTAKVGQSDSNSLEVPSTFHGQLKDYQVDGFRWLCRLSRHGLNGLLGRAAVLRIVRNWSEELTRFAPTLRQLLFVGDRDARHERKQEFRASRPDVVVTTYEMCIKEADFFQSQRWSMMVVDEAQRIKNSKSLLYYELNQITNCGFRLLMTGTPIQNNLYELNALLHFLNPELFNVSSRSFARWFTPPRNATHDTIDILTSELQEMIAPFILRREKSVAVADLPIKKEVVLYSGISALQKRLYKSILTKDLHAFENGNKTSLNNILMQLRKCVNHPYLFHGVEPEPFELGDHLIEASGKLWLLDRLLKHLHAGGHRVLIFSQMTAMLDVLQDYLYYRSYTYERLDGSVRGEERYMALEKFTKSPETFIFLLSTRAGGVGLNLVQADVVIFFDSDFNPQMDIQAAARAHRIGQTKPVTIIRLVSRGTVEELILKRAERKLKLATRIFGSQRFAQSDQTAEPKDVEDLQTVLKYGLDELMQNDDSTIIDEDLKYILTVDALDSDSAATTTPIVKPELPEAEEAAEAAEQETIYEYAGEDYSKKATAKDSDAFENLKKSVVATGLVPAPRKRKPPVQLEPVGLPSTTARHRPRKVMTKEERWAKAGYTSLKLMLDVVDRYSVSDGELQYRQGSVTNPVDVAGTARPIIVHCVDNSGAWTNRGVFRALSELSPRVEEVYTTAGSIKDLHVGDAHLIDLAPGAPVMVALVVAYRRDREGYLSDFLLDDFRRGLEQVASFAVLHNASLHLPRFGLKPDRWYPIERTIRGEVVARGVPAVVYYHPRGGRGDTYGARSVVATSRDAPVVATPRDSTVIATPTDVSTHAETPSTVPATPPIFDDLLIHLYTTPSEKDALADKKHRLTRYIAAYGGDTTDIIQDASHVVVLGDTDAELLAGYLCVRPDWIVDSIKSGQLLSASKYRRIA